MIADEKRSSGGRIEWSVCIHVIRVKGSECGTFWSILVSERLSVVVVCVFSTMVVHSF